MYETNYLGIFLWILFMFAIPLGFVLTDPSIGKKEKVVWSALVLWSSWLAGLLYFWLAPLWPDEAEEYEELERIEPGFGDP